jgi:hypothetical protein
MRDGANTGKGAMRKKLAELRPLRKTARDESAHGERDEHKAREADAVARAVLEALSAHDPL